MKNTPVKERLERYTLAREPGGVRITFDQRKGAVVNAAFGVALAVLGYVWDAPVGTVVMGGGVVWTLFSMLAYSSERVTELGEVLTYRNGRKARTLSVDEVIEVAVRVRRGSRGRRKQSVLPWSVEIRGGGQKPFASYRFQEEEPARKFAAYLSHALGTALVDRTDPPRAAPGAS